jgi:predicted histidine transporter YuiF (NhaC family)
LQIFFVSRGEDGYFRVAQYATEPYGLFGVLAEGIIVQAQNVTVQVEDEAQNVPFPVWAIILLIVLGLLVLLLCLYLTWRWMRSKPKEYVSEEKQMQQEE